MPWQTRPSSDVCIFDDKASFINQIGTNAPSSSGANFYAFASLT